MVSQIAEAARYWLRRELVSAGLDGALVPRLVNPRTQGWLSGFVAAIGEELGLDAAKRYELEARLFVSLFDGTPMGEQLGLEALQMAKLAQSGPKAMFPDWDEYFARGGAVGRHFAGLTRGLEEFGQTLR